MISAKSRGYGLSDRKFPEKCLISNFQCCHNLWLMAYSKSAKHNLCRRNWKEETMTPYKMDVSIGTSRFSAEGPEKLVREDYRKVS